MKVACHPHIVGIELEELMETIANDASKILIELTSIKNLDSDEIIFEHILRAAPGYCLHKALRRNNLDFREVWIRPRYKLPSYRDHDEEDVKEIEIVYQDFSQIPEGCELTVIKPDTEASGRTAEVSLKKLQEEVEKKNSRLRELIIYGFISEHALKIIEDKASKLGFKKIYFIALGNITSLCYNMYDMPLYGPDESYYSQYHEIRKLGGITDIEVLEEYLPEFIPGSDQPGDWSARQEKLYTGTEYESGRISNHLENSIRLIKRLWEISKDQEWFMEFHEEAIKKELEKLYQKLREYKP
ncbi:MAG: hypothetical protein NZ929_05280 [Aigarchaeota archaeon]|nr:hypothetical protein [Aigarchaeota archaeon]MDW7986999.1 hypothetical protein [Nitrososphaerota archaeon]